MDWQAVGIVLGVTFGVMLFVGIIAILVWGVTRLADRYGWSDAVAFVLSFLSAVVIFALGIGFISALSLN